MMGQKLIDLTGQKFGRLSILSFKERKNKHTYWNAICDCGKEYTVNSTNLKTGSTVSCGCWRLENSTKHGKCIGGDIPTEYSIWSMMKDRCLNITNRNYHNYGGRGITVCNIWLDKENGFQRFLEDMGYRPSKEHSLDRINNDGNYEPKNCRWATQKQQVENRRVGRKVINIETNEYFPTISSAAQHAGINKGYFRDMIVGKRVNKTKYKLYEES